MAEPVLLLGKQRFSNVDIRIRVKGGGHVSQIYAIRQAIAKALVAFYQKCACLMLRRKPHSVARVYDACTGPFVCCQRLSSFACFLCHRGDADRHDCLTFVPCSTSQNIPQASRICW